jgi:hypothetical protein
LLPSSEKQDIEAGRPVARSRNTRAFAETFAEGERVVLL